MHDESDHDDSTDLLKVVNTGVDVSVTFNSTKPDNSVAGIK